MRYVYIALIVLLTAVVLIFKFQNLTSVTISLLGMSATLLVSTLVILVYLLGMVTGSALFGLVRSWIHEGYAVAALIGPARSFAGAVCLCAAATGVDSSWFDYSNSSNMEVSSSLAP